MNSERTDRGETWLEFLHKCVMANPGNEVLLFHSTVDNGGPHLCVQILHWSSKLQERYHVERWFTIEQQRDRDYMASAVMAQARELNRDVNQALINRRRFEDSYENHRPFGANQGGTA